MLQQCVLVLALRLALVLALGDQRTLPNCRWWCFCGAGISYPMLVLRKSAACVLWYALFQVQLTPSCPLSFTRKAEPP